MLVVVDATTRQNGPQQARLFGDPAGVIGVALTKLGGSATAASPSRSPMSSGYPSS
jgi:fused signal recognition particle receptor